MSVAWQTATRIADDARRQLYTVLATFGFLMLIDWTAHAQVVIIATPERTPTDAVKIRFSFCVARNSGSVNAHPKIKILCATFRVWGGNAGDPADYWIEANVYSSRWAYDDHACPVGGLEGVETYDEASIRIAIPDYVRKGLTGCRTFAPQMFPRQTYNIDYIEGLYKTDMMSQANLNGEIGTVEISRGEIVTDKTGWQHNAALTDTTIFRQWNASVTFRGTRYDMAFALPDEQGRFLCPNEMPTLGGEFMANAGAFQVYYWDFQFQRNGRTRWERVEEWKVIRDDQLPGVANGVRVVPFEDRYVLEMSNTGGGPPYLPLGTKFSIPRGKPPIDKRSRTKASTGRAAQRP